MKQGIYDSKGNRIGSYSIPDEIESPVRSSDLLSCEWTDGADGPCETACGHSMDFEYDGPKENQFKFCPYCGLRLVVKQDNDKVNDERQP